MELIQRRVPLWAPAELIHAAVLARHGFWFCWAQGALIQVPLCFFGAQPQWACVVHAVCHEACAVVRFVVVHAHTYL